MTLLKDIEAYHLESYLYSSTQAQDPTAKHNTPKNVNLVSTQSHQFYPSLCMSQTGRSHHHRSHLPYLCEVAASISSGILSGVVVHLSSGASTSQPLHLVPRALLAHGLDTLL